MTRWTLVVLAVVGLTLAGCEKGGGAAPPREGGGTEVTAGRHRVRNDSRRRPGRAQVANLGQIPTLNLEVLDAEPGPFEPGRDPFRYGKAERKVSEPRATPPPPPPPPPVEKSQDTGPVRAMAPPFPHTYIGSFGPPSLRIAVFEDSDGNILNASEGEVIEDKFRIAKIGYESVDIEFVGFPDEPPERKQIGG